MGPKKAAEPSDRSDTLGVGSRATTAARSGGGVAVLFAVAPSGVLSCCPRGESYKKVRALSRFEFRGAAFKASGFGFPPSESLPFLVLFI